MRFVLTLGALVGALIFPLRATAASEPVCDAEPYTEVRTLSGLPETVVRQLMGNRLGIADRGAPFNDSDVDRHGMPTQRFGIAAASDDCILVAVEQGGRGYHVQLLQFERHGDTWTGQKLWVTFGLPRSADELVRWISYPGE